MDRGRGVNKSAGRLVFRPPTGGGTLNTVVSRRAFLKTAGVTAAGVAAAGLGLGGVASGQKPPPAGVGLFPGSLYGARDELGRYTQFQDALDEADQHGVPLVVEAGTWDLCPTESAYECYLLQAGQVLTGQGFDEDGKPVSTLRFVRSPDEGLRGPYALGLWVVSDTTVDGLGFETLGCDFFRWVAPVVAFAEAGDPKATNARITNNYVANFYNYGIYLTNCDDSLVANNVIEDFVRVGIALSFFPTNVGCSNNTLVGNTIRLTRPGIPGLRQYGIWVVASDHNDIIRNTIQNVADWVDTCCIRLEVAGSYNRIARNTVEGTFTYGISLDSGSSFNKVCGNDLSGTTAEVAQVHLVASNENYFGPWTDPDDTLTSPGNAFGPVLASGLGVYVDQGQLNVCQHNDFTRCNFLGTVPGWSFEGDEVATLGCIWLGGDDAYVAEHPRLGTKYFPPGTSVCDQVYFDPDSANTVQNWDELCSDDDRPRNRDRIMEKFHAASCRRRGGDWVRDRVTGEWYCEDATGGPEEGL